eukprot:GGOE01062127.1.p1 GENE.GGOE01062127.1~~GGOE01062127.1.p1  ORF type:complete len:943 (-),score=233.76 GGOE01062127.1:188-3016(-)
MVTASWFLASVLQGLSNSLSLLLQISAAVRTRGLLLSPSLQSLVGTLLSPSSGQRKRHVPTMNLPPLSVAPLSPHSLRLHSRKGSLLLCKPLACPRSPPEAERLLSIVTELATSIVQSHGGVVLSGATRDVIVGLWELSPDVQPEILACGCAMFLRQRLEVAAESACSIVLHSGEFLIAEAGGRYPWPTALGEEFHLAHRLLYALEDKQGSIAVTDSVHGAVSDAFSTTELSPVRGSSMTVFTLAPAASFSPTSPTCLWWKDAEELRCGPPFREPQSPVGVPMPLIAVHGQAAGARRHLSPSAVPRRRRGSSPVANELPHLSVRMYANADSPNHPVPNTSTTDRDLFGGGSGIHLLPYPNDMLLSPSSRQTVVRRRTQSLAIPTVTVSLFGDSPTSVAVEKIPAVLVEATEACYGSTTTVPEEEPSTSGSQQPSDQMSGSHQPISDHMSGSQQPIIDQPSDGASQRSRQHVTSPLSDRPAESDDFDASSNTLGARAASIQWSKRVVYYDDPNTRENTDSEVGSAVECANLLPVLPQPPPLLQPQAQHPLHRWQALAEEYTAVLSRGNSEITTDDSRRGSMQDTKSLSPLRSFRHAGSFFSNSTRLARHCSAPSIHRQVSTPGSHYSMQQDGRFQTEDEWWESLNPMKRHWSLSALLSQARMITTVKPNGDTEAWHCSQHLLGKGSFGEVCLGMSKSGLLVAVKRIRVEEEMKRQLMTEIKLLGKIQHENIIQYYGSCLEGGHVLLVTEYACTTLAKVLAAFGKLTPAVAGRFTRDIVTGLRYLHGKGVVHRDVKPENVLMNQLGVCKLADFGTATFLSRSLRNSGEIAGTPQFIAPEVVNGEVSMAADIWAVGVTLWFALLAKPLVDSTTNNTWAVLYRVGSMEETPVIPEEVTGDARAFLASCLAIHPDHRATAADLLTSAFLSRCTLSPCCADGPSIWQS